MLSGRYTPRGGGLPTGGGSLSTLVKPVTFRKKPVTHYPRRVWITPNFGHFPYKRLKKMLKKIPASSAPGFCNPTPGVRARLSNGMALYHILHNTKIGDFFEIKMPLQKKKEGKRYPLVVWPCPRGKKLRVDLRGQAPQCCP